MPNSQPEGEEKSYTLTIDLQVLEHLGIGLYSNTPAVVSELVANAYDADAERVDITVNRNEIIIQDDGTGMDEFDANDKFLKVGYRKRDKETKTRIYERSPMGRKGIGKLSVFAIAQVVEVHSVKTDKEGNRIGEAAFLMDSEEIKSLGRKDYHPKPIPLAPDLEKGTKIVLRDLKSSRAVSDIYLCRNLSRRFSILGHNFIVAVNDKEISLEDRQYWQKLQFVWGIGDSKGYQLAKGKGNVLQSRLLPNEAKGGHPISGWIGTVRLPRELKDDNTDNNGIVVLARGKVVHDNLLPFARTSRIFAEYVVGELNAEWLDEDSDDDMATSGRQSLREDDPRFQLIREFLSDRLNDIAEDWGQWRKRVSVKEAVDVHPILQDWISSLSKDNQKYAEKIITTIQAMPVSDPDAKKDLFKQGIIAFETLALRGNIAALAKLDHPSWEQVEGIFQGINDLEAAHYYDIIKGRFEVLNVFERIVEDDEPEKKIQEYLYKHLWLLSPAWERATMAETSMEKRFLKKLDGEKLGIDRNEALSRYDIRYLTYSGKYIILELKRSQRSISEEELLGQIRKYKRIMEKWLRSMEPELQPQIEIICLLGKLPPEAEHDQRGFTENLRANNASVLTYQGLIQRTRDSYADFLGRQKEIQRIQNIIDGL